ncbi:MAG TPA: response regulator transcription factor [Acidimicrobiales bacterium]|nr:response regulator transcription factor [Acidimicrobiales bacterium]
MHRVLIVDDHPLVAVGLQLALRSRGWDVQVADGPSAGAVLERARAFEPGCVLLDLHLGELGNGRDLIGPLRETSRAVVMLTGETDRLLLAACVAEGADGWIGKDAFVDDVIAAVEDALAGRPLLGVAKREELLDDLRAHRAGLARSRSRFERLSPREQRVLGALVDGLSSEEIAEAQFVAVSTVRSQVRGILCKLGVRSQLAAVAAANREGWAGPVPSTGIHQS